MFNYDDYDNDYDDIEYQYMSPQEQEAFMQKIIKDSGMDLDDIY